VSLMARKCRGGCAPDFNVVLATIADFSEYSCAQGREEVVYLLNFVLTSLRTTDRRGYRGIPVPTVT
jgi:hypothetical protein